MTNVAEALNKKGIGPKVLAALLNVSEKTAWNKINGLTEFTVSEAIKTRSAILREYDFEYLFGDRDNDTPQNYAAR